MGRLTGVMDDRGKYIYVSPAEMEAVAAHIKSVGILDLAVVGNQRIKSDPVPGTNLVSYTSPLLFAGVKARTRRLATPT
eukprot:9323076-Pyramimonas_sp.AAC.2